MIHCIGHDMFTGLEAATFHQLTETSGKSFVFHHMNYEAYSNIKQGVELLKNEQKFQAQRDALQKADVVLSVGPKLFDSAVNKIKPGNPVFQILPGIEELTPKSLSPVFSAIAFDRYDASNDRLKQMLLAAKAFCVFADATGSLRQDATFTIVGISSTEEADELKRNATAGLTGYFNINGKPYTHNRKELFDILASHSVCLMLSVHEGFGLVGLEAIAAGVPLIISINTGLYEFLSNYLQGEDLKKYGIYPVHVLGSNDGSTDEQDLQSVVEAFTEVTGALEGFFRKNSFEILKIGFKKSNY